MYVCIHIYIHIYEHINIRTSQSMIYVRLLVNRSHKRILLIVQVQIFEILFREFILQDLIQRTRLCGTGFIPQHC